jgi:hypothetical protein
MRKTFFGELAGWVKTRVKRQHLHESSNMMTRRGGDGDSTFGYLCQRLIYRPFSGLLQPYLFTVQTHHEPPLPAETTPYTPTETTPQPLMDVTLHAPMGGILPTDKDDASSADGRDVARPDAYMPRTLTRTLCGSTTDMTARPPID